VRFGEGIESAAKLDEFSGLNPSRKLSSKIDRFDGSGQQ
jgi:hypothetical protein